jgi:DedD protein
MLTRPEAADPAVEELKRRARRRLVGAVVLALAAAVILPLLLESDPKPLGDDVSIQIPPIDNGKFITRFPPKAPDAKAAPNVTSAPPAPAAKPAAVTPDSRAETKAGASSDAEEAKRPDGSPAPIAVAPSADAVAPPGSDSSPVTADAAKSAAPARAISAASTPAPASPAGAIVVQVGAFEDSKAAAALSSKLRSAGYPVYVDTVKTPKGSMKRVRVGPYAAREIADAEMGKLKASGYRGVVTTK